MTRIALSAPGRIRQLTDVVRRRTGRENLLHFARMLPDGAEERIPELARLVALEELPDAGWSQRQLDVVARNTERHALAVPPREELVQRVAHLTAEPQPVGHRCRDEAVGVDDGFDRTPSGGHETGGDPKALQRWAAGSGVPEHESDEGQTGLVELIAVVPVGDVVRQRPVRLRHDVHVHVPEGAIRQVIR